MKKIKIRRKPNTLSNNYEPIDEGGRILLDLVRNTKKQKCFSNKKFNIIKDELTKYIDFEVEVVDE